MSAADVDAEQLVVLRDLWQVTARQIEKRLLEGFTGTIELNCLRGRVKNYSVRDVKVPEEEERRLADRRETARPGEDRRTG